MICPQGWCQFLWGCPRPSSKFLWLMSGNWWDDGDEDHFVVDDKTFKGTITVLAQTIP